MNSIASTASTASTATQPTEKRTNVRWTIVVILFFITAINYGDRATISIAGSPMAKELGMGHVLGLFAQHTIASPE